MSSNHSKRILAMPFLITVAASSCVVKTGGPSQQPTGHPVPSAMERENVNSQDGGEAAVDSYSTPVAPVTPLDEKNPPIVMNPPAPVTESKTPAPNQLNDPPLSGGNLHVQADGSCWWVAKTACSASANVTCNPPMPLQVNCPTK